MLLTGVLERQEDSAVARQLPSLSELQVGALTGGMTSFVLTCASLAAKMSSGNPVWDRNPFPDLCNPGNVYFWASFFPRNPKSFSVCHGCHIIYMQTARMNTLHMQIESASWKFSVPSLPAARLGRPADTQPGHFIHYYTKPSLAPLFLRITEYKGLEERGSLSLNNSIPFVGPLVSMWPSYCKPVFLVMEHLRLYSLGSTETASK